MWKGRKGTLQVSHREYLMEAATVPRVENLKEKSELLQSWILSWNSALWLVDLKEALSKMACRPWDGVGLNFQLAGSTVSKVGSRLLRNIAKLPAMISSCDWKNCHWFTERVFLFIVKKQRSWVFFIFLSFLWPFSSFPIFFPNSWLQSLNRSYLVKVKMWVAESQCHAVESRKVEFKLRDCF